VFLLEFSHPDYKETGYDVCSVRDYKAKDDWYRAKK